MDEMREWARKQFEEWAKPLSPFEGAPDPFKREEVLTGKVDYFWGITEAAWLAWQAGAREELRSAARVIRESFDTQGLTNWRDVADWLERRAK